MGESRQELLGWMNSLLQTNITKVEQCGTGAPLCQIFDSIFRKFARNCEKARLKDSGTVDVQMSKVKFNVNTEYAYLQNFKVLQNTFTKHQIERPIPVESLIKCKMQDNLEFLQWTKRYWDQYYPGIEYDPVGRRKAAGTSISAAPSAAGATYSANARTSTSGGARRPAATSNTAAARAPRAGSAGLGGASSAVLQQQNAELKESVTGLEKERQFYFNKLRDIEDLLQEEVAAKPELENEENGLVGRLQAILYSTEEGFEIPAEYGEEGFDGNAVGDEETF